MENNAKQFFANNFTSEKLLGKNFGCFKNFKRNHKNL